VDQLAYVPPFGIIAAIVGLQTVYLLTTGPYRNRIRDSRPVPRARRIAFSASMLVLLVALASPLDVLADEYLFTAHMVQHLLLTLVAAPLLLYGTPGWLATDMLQVVGLTGVVRWSRNPLVTFFGFNLVFALSHIPAFYELTLAWPPLHALEHLVFVATALLMWMPILSPVPALYAPYPPLGQVLYLFLQTVPASLLGALLASAGAAFYPTYVLAPRLVPWTPLEDQQIGGLLMWVGSGLYFLLASGVVFFVWASREEAANRRPVGVH
jgi:putative membrane protein